MTADTPEDAAKTIVEERLSALATRSRYAVSAPIDGDLVRRKADDSRVNARLREIHVFHDGDDDPVHRMLNAMQPATYVRPHRHLTVPKSETVVVLQGSAAAVCFEEDGSVDWRHTRLLDAERGVMGVDLRPGVWHTFLSLAADTVLLEVKPGPYSVATDKDFAPWAPVESAPEALGYLGHLQAAVRGRFELEDPDRTPR